MYVSVVGECQHIVASKLTSASLVWETRAIVHLYSQGLENSDYRMDYRNHIQFSMETKNSSWLFYGNIRIVEPWTSMENFRGNLHGNP